MYNYYLFKAIWIELHKYNKCKQKERNRLCQK